MIKKQIYWTCVGIFSVALFGGLGVAGWRFIQQLDNNRDTTVPQMASTPINTSDLSVKYLSVKLESVSGNLKNTDESFVAHSTGNDVMITSGNFSYGENMPVVRLQLHNQGKFPISALRFSFILQLNGSDITNSATAQIDVPLDTPLTPDGTTAINVNIPNAAWQTREIFTAKRKKILAKIISATDANSDGISYPQNAAAVGLNPTNTVVNPIDDTPSEENSLPETEIPDSENNETGNEPTISSTIQREHKSRYQRSLEAQDDNEELGGDSFVSQYGK